MLKKFDEEISKIIFEHSKQNIVCESNGYQYADDLLEDIFDIRGYHDFKEFKKDEEVLSKLKLTDKQVLKDACDGLWIDSIEKLDPEDESEAPTYEFCKQLYYFLKEMV
jgi:hypothetical protein